MECTPSLTEHPQTDLEIVVDDPTAPEDNSPSVTSTGTVAVPRPLCRTLPPDAGFMRAIGKIALWESLLTAVVFTAIMFVTFDIALDVIMPKGLLEAAFGIMLEAPSPVSSTGKTRSLASPAMTVSTG